MASGPLGPGFAGVGGRGCGDGGGSDGTEGTLADALARIIVITVVVSGLMSCGGCVTLGTVAH